MKLEKGNPSKYSKVFSRFTTWSVIAVLAIAVIFTFSKTAHAGLFSLIFGGEQASAKVNVSPSTPNLQTLALLQPAVNVDPNPDKTADIVPVDNDSILVPDLASDNSTSTDTSNTQISTYIVRQGDTISSIAKMFKVSVNTILWANSLTSKSALKAGQTIVILPISGVSYTVKKGDTMSSIAQKSHADVDDILSYNNIAQGESISVGQTLIIPDGEPLVAIAARNAITSSKSAGSEPLLDNVSKWPSYPGYYIMPLAGGHESQGLHGHNAVDLAAPKFTPLMASAAGTVIISKMNGAYNGGYGNYVVISHDNGTQTLYAHMDGSSSGLVSVGQRVSQGQTIGYIGMTGHTTGPHVHFEIRGARNPF